MLVIKKKKERKKKETEKEIKYAQSVSSQSRFEELLAIGREYRAWRIYNELRVKLPGHPVSRFDKLIKLLYESPSERSSNVLKLLSIGRLYCALFRFD